MALVNKTWRLGEFVPPGAEPGLTRKFVWRDIEQEKATQDIATARFDFPNSRYPTLKTFTNRPARQVGVRMSESRQEMAFPDIVVLEDPSNEVRMLGEVETHRSLRETPEADLVEKWQAFIFLGDLYLFVPLMRVDGVNAMLKRNKLKIAGLRSWRYITGQGLIDIADMRN
jgi:hypothetical protein